MRMHDTARGPPHKIQLYTLAEYFRYHRSQRNRKGYDRLIHWCVLVHSDRNLMLLEPFRYCPFLLTSFESASFFCLPGGGGICGVACSERAVSSRCCWL